MVVQEVVLVLILLVVVQELLIKEIMVVRFLQIANAVAVAEVLVL
jgi:hypothetical protein